MRIAFVISHTPFYGANQSLLCMIEGLQEYGVESYVMVPGQGSVVEALAEKNIPYRILPFKRWMSRNRWKAPARLGMNVALLPLFVRQFKKWDIDLVYSNDSEVVMGAFAARVLGLPHVWHIREMADSALGLSYDWGRSFFEKWLRQANAVVAVSQAVLDKYIGRINPNTYVIHDSIMNTEAMRKLKIETRNELRQRKDIDCIFAVVGRVQPLKAQEQAIRAIHKVKEHGYRVRLLIAGEGETVYTEYLLQLCNNLGLQQTVSFLGHVSEPLEIYKSADVTLMCSKGDAFPRVVLESMIIGRPVIGNARGGILEQIEPGTTGLLYNDSVNELVNCMEYLIKNPEKAREMGLRGQEFARQFTNEKYAGAIYEVLQTIT